MCFLFSLILSFLFINEIPVLFYVLFYLIKTPLDETLKIENSGGGSFP